MVLTELRLRVGSFRGANPTPKQLLEVVGRLGGVEVLEVGGVGGAECGDVLLEQGDHLSLALAAEVRFCLELEGGLFADDGHEGLEILAR